MLLITFLKLETLDFRVIAQKIRTQFNHLLEYSLLTGDKVSGGFRTKSTVSMFYIFHVQDWVSMERF